jgi:hypothetical protein
LFRGLKIDDQLEGGWLLNRQIGGLGALEDLSGVGAEQAIHAGKARPVADQAPGRNALAPLVHGGNGVAFCQGNQLLAPAVEERVGANQQGTGGQFGNAGEGGFEVGVGTGEHKPGLYAQNPCGVLDLFSVRLIWE